MPTDTTTKGKAQRVKLTLERISRFGCPEGVKQAFLWDEDAPRLAVRATAGSKSFVFEGKLARRTIRRTIGSVQTWTIEAARKEARELQALLDKGTDPRELDRREAEARTAAETAKKAAADEAERNARFTLLALCDAYTNALDRAGKKRSAKAAASAFNCHVSTNDEIASKPARNVTPHDVAALVRKVREAGKERTAGVLRAYLSAAFNAAKRAPFDSALPAALIAFEVEHNPCDAIPAIPVQRGQRTLVAAELRAYIGHLRRVGKESSPDMVDHALTVALLAGGQRMAQLLRAKVSDFNAEAGTLRLLDPKGKRTTPREHLLPLAPRACALVGELVERAKKRDGGNGDTWIFSTRKGVPMAESTPGKRASEIAASMDGEPFDLRDVRRTVETMLAGLGVSREARAQLLSHGISGVQAAHYDRHAYTTEKRAALLAWEAKLDAIERNAPMPGNVLPLERRA